MADILNAGGTTTSLTNTPQAGDDTYNYLEDLLYSDSTLYNQLTNTLTIDVMKNDLGGKAKSLFSISDVDGTPIDDLTACDLLTNSKNSLWEQTTQGNWIRIWNGKVEYRLNDGTNPNTNPGAGLDINSIAGGTTLHDTFVYAIKLGNGTLSWATVTINIAGANDAATISGQTSGGVSEDAATNTVSGDLNVNDIDSGEARFQAPASGSLTGTYGNFVFNAETGGWTFTLDNSRTAVQALAAGQTATQGLTVTSLDGTASQTITITITGTNDGPVVAAADVTGAVSEMGTASGNLTDTGTIAFTDVDLLDVHSVGAVTASAGALGTLTASVTTDTTGTGLGGVVSWDYSVAASAVEYLAAGETRIETFTFSISDGQGGSVARTVSVTITGTNDGPDVSVMAGDSAGDSLDEGNAALTLAGTLSVEDLDTSDMVSTSVTEVTKQGDKIAMVSSDDLMAMFSLAQASLAADQDSTGNLGWSFNSGSEAFDFLAVGETLILTYTVEVQDNHGATDSQDITITIHGTNDGPTGAAVAELVLGTEDLAYTVSAADLLDGFSDVDGDSLSISNLLADHGTVTANPDGSFTIEPAANYHGPVTLTYQVNDGNGGSVPGTLSFELASVQDLFVDPTATRTIAEDQQLISQTGAYSWAIGGNGLTSHSIDPLNGAQHGTVTIDAGGQYTYTPDHNFHGTDSFTVIVYDPTADETLTQVVTVTVDSVDDLVVAPTASAATNEDQQLIGNSGAGTSSGGLLQHSIDPSGDAQHGSVTIDAGGQYTYTPDANFHGTDSFTIVVDDPAAGETRSQVVTVTVNPVVDLIASPVLANSGIEDQTIYGMSDAGTTSGGTKVFSIDPLNGAQHGTVTIDAGGQYSYIPGANFNGTDSFTILIDDPASGESLSQVIEVTVHAVNDAAVITGTTSAAATEAGGGDNTAAGVDPSGDLDSTDVDGVDDAWNPAGPTATVSGYGSFVINAAGQWTYIVNQTNPDVQALAPGATLSDSFTVTTADGTPQVVNVTINGANDAPKMLGDMAATVAEGGSFVVTAELVGHSDPDDIAADALYTVSAVTDGEIRVNGVVQATFTGAQLAAGLVTFVHGGGEAAEASFDLTVEDGNEDGSVPTPTTFFITVTPVNDAAVISGTLSGSVTEDAAPLPTSVGGDANSTDVDGIDDAWIADSGSSAYGSWSVNAAGQWSYTLNNANPSVNGLNTGQTLPDSFVIQTADGTSATVAITINGAADVTALILPNTFTGTGDPNDKDASGNPADQNLSNAGTNDDDTLYGGAGNDTINGGGGNDTIYAGSGNDSANGNNDSDKLFGGSGNDTLQGSNGIDTLVGGYGADVLTGGGEADIFQFLSLLDTNDRIVDFGAGGADKLDFAGIDANAASVGDQAFGWGGTSATANGLWYQYDAVNNVTKLYGDTDGNLATAEFMVTFDGNVDLNAAQLAGIITL